MTFSITFFFFYDFYFFPTPRKTEKNTININSTLNKYYSPINIRLNNKVGAMNLINRNNRTKENQRVVVSPYQ